MDDGRPVAYSYVRMSTDAQLKGDSLRRQTELSQRYADSHGLKLVEEAKLHDIGVSAFKGDNVATGALGKFLGALNSGQVPRGSYSTPDLDLKAASKFMSHRYYRSVAPDQEKRLVTR